MIDILDVELEINTPGIENQKDFLFLEYLSQIDILDIELEIDILGIKL